MRIFMRSRGAMEPEEVLFFDSTFSAILVADSGLIYASYGSHFASQGFF